MYTNDYQLRPRDCKYMLDTYKGITGVSTQIYGRVLFVPMCMCHGLRRELDLHVNFWTRMDSKRQYVADSKIICMFAFLGWAQLSANLSSTC